MRAHIPEAALNDYADGLLAAEDAAGVERHLAACEACGTYVRRLRALSVRLSAVPRGGEPGRDLWAGVAARVAEAESREAAAAVETVPGVVPLRPRRAPAATVWLQRAAAAAVLFVGGVGVGQRMEPERVVVAPPTTIGGVATQTAATPNAAAGDIQRAGTEYVRAVAHFSAMAGSASPHEVAQAREAAIAALYGAAKELTELPGDDRSAQEIFRTVASTRDGAAVAARDSVTFPGDTPGVRF